MVLNQFWISLILSLLPLLTVAKPLDEKPPAQVQSPEPSLSWDLIPKKEPNPESYFSKKLWLAGGPKKTGGESGGGHLFEAKIAASFAPLLEELGRRNPHGLNLEDVRMLLSKLQIQLSLDQSLFKLNGSELDNINFFPKEIKILFNQNLWKNYIFSKDILNDKFYQAILPYFYGNNPEQLAAQERLNIPIPRKPLDFSQVLDGEFALVESPDRDNCVVNLAVDRTRETVMISRKESSGSQECSRIFEVSLGLFQCHNSTLTDCVEYRNKKSESFVSFIDRNNFYFQNSELQSELLGDSNKEKLSFRRKKAENSTSNIFSGLGVEASFNVDLDLSKLCLLAERKAIKKSLEACQLLSQESLRSSCTVISSNVSFQPGRIARHECTVEVLSTSTDQLKTTQSNENSFGPQAQNHGRSESASSFSNSEFRNKTFISDENLATTIRQIGLGLSHHIEKRYPQISQREFSKLVRETRIEFSDDINLFTLPGSTDEAPRDAVQFFGASKKLIIFYRARLLEYLNLGLDLSELVLHEFLPYFLGEDTGYKSLRIESERKKIQDLNLKHLQEGHFIYALGYGHPIQCLLHVMPRDKDNSVNISWVDNFIEGIKCDSSSSLIQFFCPSGNLKYCVANQRADSELQLSFENQNTLNLETYDYERKGVTVGGGLMRRINKSIPKIQTFKFKGTAYFKDSKLSYAQICSVAAHKAEQSALESCRSLYSRQASRCKVTESKSWQIDGEREFGHCMIQSWAKIE